MTGHGTRWAPDRLLWDGLALAIGALASLAVGLGDMAFPALGRLTGWSRS